jgi:hypothetical protein
MNVIVNYSSNNPKTCEASTNVIFKTLPIKKTMRFHNCSLQLMNIDVFIQQEIFSYIVENISDQKHVCLDITQIFN